MISSSSPSSSSLPPGGSFAIFAVNTALLVAYHVAYTNKNDDDDNIHTNSAHLSLLDKILFGGLVLMAFELLDFITKHSGKWLQSKRVPVRGKHLDELRNIDKLCIGFSKANTSPFTYFYFRYCWIMSASGVIPWHWKQVSWTNALLPLPCLFVMFDATYCLLHYILHWQCLYGYIHKHHHIQKAPSRANIDAVNVHPVEFVLGEYNHLLAVWFWTSVLGQSLHVLAALVFVTVGGILAGINHTRYDIVLSVPVPNISGYGSRWWLLRSPTSSSSQTTTTTTSSHLPWIVPWTIYDSKAHDVHHRIPQSNYGQYTMFWDYLFGSYRPYNPNDRINPGAQLDPTTGMTVTANKREKPQ